MSASSSTTTSTTTTISDKTISDKVFTSLDDDIFSRVFHRNVNIIPERDVLSVGTICAALSATTMNETDNRYQDLTFSEEGDPNECFMLRVAAVSEYRPVLLLIRSSSEGLFTDFVSPNPIEIKELYASNPELMLRLQNANTYLTNNKTQSLPQGSAAVSSVIPTVLAVVDIDVEAITTAISAAIENDDLAQDMLKDFYASEPGTFLVRIAEIEHPDAETSTHHAFRTRSVYDRTYIHDARRIQIPDVFDESILDTMVHTMANRELETNYLTVDVESPSQPKMCTWVRARQTYTSLIKRRPGTENRTEWICVECSRKSFYQYARECSE